jgi:hypothetical protein
VLLLLMLMVVLLVVLLDAAADPLTCHVTSRCTLLAPLHMPAGGHKDEYIATYHNYTAGPIPDEAFHLPDGMATDDCTAAAPDAAMAAAAAASAATAAGGAAPTPRSQPGALRRQFALHMPSVHWGHAAYDSFMHR